MVARRPRPATSRESREGGRGSLGRVDDEPLICSARGCRAAASWALRWSNPKLHAPDRRKTWLACDAHRVHLSNFLEARGFLRAVDGLA